MFLLKPQISNLKIKIRTKYFTTDCAQNLINSTKIATFSKSYIARLKTHSLKFIKVRWIFKSEMFIQCINQLKNSDLLRSRKRCTINFCCGMESNLQVQQAHYKMGSGCHMWSQHRQGTCLARVYILRIVLLRLRCKVFRLKRKQQIGVLWFLPRSLWATCTNPLLHTNSNAVHQCFAILYTVLANSVQSKQASEIFASRVRSIYLTSKHTTNHLHASSTQANLLQILTQRVRKLQI